MLRTCLTLVTLFVCLAAVCRAESGDLNADGRVDERDLRMLEDYLSGSLVLQEGQLAGADADGDGKVGESDRELLQRRLKGLSVQASKSQPGRQQVDLTSTYSGVVTDRETGRPLANVEVSLPDEGVVVRTDGEGRFVLPQATPGKILTARASNYAPFALTAGSSGGAMRVELERLSPRLQVLDDELHHLGDDRYSRGSANATDFRLRTEGVAYLRRFTLDRFPNSDLTLRIGSVIGLDTPQSAAAGQTQVGFFGTQQDGLRVFLNGNLVQQIYVNGDNIAVKLPRWLLRSGTNELRLETHLFNQPAAMQMGGAMGLLGALGMGGAMGMAAASSAVTDHDDIEFAHLVLEYSDGGTQPFSSPGRVVDTYAPQVRP